MKERGFSLNHEVRNSDGTTAKIIFNNDKTASGSSRLSIPVYNVTVFIDNDDIKFQLSYIVKNSMNLLESPKCGSFYNDEHFEMIMLKFEHTAAILNRYA